jgi:oligopeptide/dipeptide ABC transporter ATP-binding protein
VLELRDLTVRYGRGPRAFTAVDRVSLTVPAGRTLGLVGESGSGKSTIARAIVRLLPLASGTILLDGTDALAGMTERDYRRQVQMTFQDPTASLDPRNTVSRALDEALRIRGGLSRQQREVEARRLLSTVGLPASALPRYPHEFSGGQRQRIAIARSLAVGPRLIVLDEVTSALDVSVQATILNLLRELQSAFGLSYLIISHDLAVVEIMSDEVAVMYLGRIVETTSSEVLLREPRHPYTQALIASVPTFSTRPPPEPLGGDLPDPHRPPQGCRFHTRCPLGPLAFPDRQICIDQDPQQGAAEREHRAACHFAAPAPARESVPGGPGRGRPRVDRRSFGV